MQDDDGAPDNAEVNPAQDSGAAGTDVSSDNVFKANGVAPELRWWQSVRTRFGLLLALALLPWLILTGAEAFSTVDRNRVSQAQLSDVVATNSVREVGRMLEAGRLGLDAAPLLLEELGCEAGSREVLDRLVVYEALIVENRNDIPVCQMPASIEGLVIQNPDPFTEDNLFRIERGSIMEGDTERTVVVLQSFVRSSGRTYTLVMPKNFGPRDVLVTALGADAVIALTKPDGRGILGMDIPRKQNNYHRSIIPGDEEVLFDEVNSNGVSRRIAARYFEDLDLYVTVGRSVTFGDFAGFINPYTSVLLPIMAWIIGFVLIWLGTKSMLLTPLGKVRRTARQFSKGALGARVDLSGSAAAEVHGLARAFNQMANQLEERESRIADNVDEKDILMREIHHRVKNNLQIIISLLNMQERKADTQEAINAIAETRTRINAIAIVHRGLYESPDLRRIEIETFIERLTHSIGDSLDLMDMNVSLTQSVDKVFLSADNAIPVALFIVEAISNASAHAVANGGNIHVCIENVGGEKLLIEVRDDGRGVEDVTAMRGVGTRLMKGFARQLSGTLEFRDNGPGLVAALTIPIDDKPEQPFQVSRKS